MSKNSILGWVMSPLQSPPHLEIPVSNPFEPIEMPLVENGMALKEIQQIEDTMQMARQLEAEAMLWDQ